MKPPITEAFITSLSLPSGTNLYANNPNTGPKNINGNNAIKAKNKKYQTYRKHMQTSE